MACNLWMLGFDFISQRGNCPTDQKGQRRSGGLSGGLDETRWNLSLGWTGQKRSRKGIYSHLFSFIACNLVKFFLFYLYRSIFWSIMRVLWLEKICWNALMKWFSALLTSTSSLIFGQVLVFVYQTKRCVIKLITLLSIQTVKSFLPDMLAQGSGHIVTIASMAGMTGVNRLVDYCASKFAAVGFDEALRVELHVIIKNRWNETVNLNYFYRLRDIKESRQRPFVHFLSRLPSFTASIPSKEPLMKSLFD